MRRCSRESRAADCIIWDQHGDNEDSVGGEEEKSMGTKKMKITWRMEIEKSETLD